MRKLWRQWLSLEGRVSRGRYLLCGIILVALKYAIDFSVAAHFGHPWHIWNYILPPADMGLFGPGVEQRKMYFILWAIAIPFFWTGISLTVRRLRDAGVNPLWVFLFFVPIGNLLLFLFLSLDSPTEAIGPETDPPADSTGGVNFSAPVMGVLLAAVLGFALVLLSANFLARYAWGLFLGVPFVTGFVASWLFNARSLQSRKETITLCVITPMVIGLLLIGFRLEGLVCLAMALPLALPFSIAGGLTAYQLLAGRSGSLTPTRVTSCVAVLPLLMLGEHIANVQPPVRPVVTTITINAPAGVVWKNVIAFPPLAPPKDLIFRTGIAYPIGAVIEGTGVGAVRRCRFSTGDFVEPITVWDENRLLAFKVASQPPAMHEIGLGPISTPHIDGNYMRSQHGQFRLIALDERHTLLEGTTWYQDYFWPQVYWRAWSDAIVHRIHQRVLEHVKQQAESQVQGL
jgi:uncharacterized membrane protein YhaH (DUF805 family)